MELIGYAAAIVVGLAFGLFFGRLLNAVVVNWESTATAVKWSIAAILTLLGGGAGAVIFSALPGAHQPTFYLLGLGSGMIATFFTKARPRYSLKMFREVVALSEALRNEVPDVEKRALLILTAFAPPNAIERGVGIDETDFARQLEQATDSLETTDHPPQRGDA
jgi:hypothetical protein